MTAKLIIFVSLSVASARSSVLSYDSRGCWRDTRQERAISERLEGDAILDGDYKTRTNEVEKCARAANQRGYTFFGVQHGGECWSSADAEQTYRKHGRSYICRDGTGAGWANDVYEIRSSGKNKLKLQVNDHEPGGNATCRAVHATPHAHVWLGKLA